MAREGGVFLCELKPLWPELTRSAWLAPAHLLGSKGNVLCSRTWLCTQARLQDLKQGPNPGRVLLLQPVAVLEAPAGAAAR